MLARITKWGNGRGIRLPKTLLSSANMTDNDQVQIVAESGRIVIEKATLQHKTLQERMKGYSGNYDIEIVDWNKPVGKEAW